MVRGRLVGVAAILLAACQVPLAPTGSTAAVEAAPLIERDVAVTMRDGTVLRADVYRPERDGRFPVLVYRTPYGKHEAADSYQTHLKAVTRGYAVVMQDVRGRYASEGRFDPYRQEGADGYDTVEWAASQPWSNGRVGTYGLSYPGAVQWLAAVEAPPHLVAMVPAMTFSSPRNFFYTNGVFDLSWLPWIYVNIAPDVRRRLDLPGIRDAAEATRTWPGVADEYRSWLPLRDLPFLRREAPFYFEWLTHPPEQPWWDWAELRNRYARVNAAVLNLSGWHDDSYGPEGAITNFKGLQTARGTAGDPRAQLLLGPWTHGVGATAERRIGQLDFGPNAPIDYDGVVLDFLDRYLRGIDNGHSQAPPVRYFVMGENAWRTASSWPPAGTHELQLYVAADRDRRLLQFGRSMDGPSQSVLIADPRNPVRDLHEDFGPHDYQHLAARPDVLSFDTAPLAEDLIIAGPITAEIYASCYCRDFDLWVRLQDVYPDGRAMNLMSPGNDLLRASYRDPVADPTPLVPGRVYLLRLPAMHTSIRFARGHRIRAQISASFAPHMSRNLQTGLSEVVSSESTVARITIHHGGDTASRLLLPSLPPAGKPN